MRLSLTTEQAAYVRPLLRDCEGLSTSRVVLGQLCPGDWKAPDSIELRCTTISASTARKIRRAIEQERDGDTSQPK
jgi:hypothetical protein